jgi:cytochrome c553
MTRSAWPAAAIGITAAVAIVSAVVGFVWLPLTEAGGNFQNVWSGICSAAGLIQLSPPGSPIVQPDHPMTRVEVTPRMLRGESAESIGRGATLALRCAMCHGARGLSDAEAPNLAGEYPAAIYKQLVDFKSGARASAVMAPLVAELSDADMRELAAYYAYLPRLPPPQSAEAPRIVAGGAPMRGIAPCGACHGTLDDKAGAPWLGGQPEAYLHAQLAAFANGTRRNDISAQMRNVARGMTSAEIVAASQFYAGHR